MYSNKVGIIIPSLNYGGAEKSAILLSQELNKKFKIVDLITLTKNQRNIRDNKINLISLNKVRVLYSIKKIYYLIKEKKYDTIITGLAHLNFIIIIINTLLKKKNKFNLIIHFHNVPNLNKFNFREKILNYFIFKLIKLDKNENIKIVTVSKYIKEYIINKYKIDNKKVNVIYPVVDFKKIDKLKRIKNPYINFNKKIIVTIGRLSEQKNHKLLIKSFANVRKQLDCNLVIIGSGKLKNKLFLVIDKYNLTKHIKIIDKVDNPYPYLFYADLFVLSSNWEGFGLVLIESLACNLKIVSTDCPGSPREILSELNTALLCKNNDSEDLTKKIMLMMNKNKLKLKFERKFLEKNFSINKHLNSYINIIKKINE